MGSTNVHRKSKVETVNRAGGRAYTLDDKAALATLVLSSFNEDQYYRSGDDTRKELTALVDRVPPEFAIKLAVVARNEYHMRTLPQILIATVAMKHAGTPNLRRAIVKVCERADDMAGIVAYYTGTFGKKLPASIIHGLRAAFDTFNSYQLGKYSLTGRDWKMIDVVRMVHPKPTEANRAALEALVKDGKYTVETWESELSEAGQTAGESKDEVKADTWKRLIAEDKLGYMALLRNLRNICAVCDKDTIATVCERIANPERVRKSKQFPFRFFSAYRELQNVNAPKSVVMAISAALDIACANVPRFHGSTAVCVDLSGSMDRAVSAKSSVNLMDIGALFGAVLGKANAGDIYAFGNYAKQLAFNPADSALTIMDIAKRPNVEHGTSFTAAIKALSAPYDRIVFMTDCQGWQGNYGRYGDNATRALAAYKKKFNCDPFVYCIDLAGYGTSKFTGGKYVQIAGFSERVFDLIGMNEIGPDALVRHIEALTL